MDRSVRSAILLCAVSLSVRSAGQVKMDTLTWTDTLRHRQVPVAIYDHDPPKEGTPVILFSHGYNENRPGSYLHYSHLAEALANAGWSVVSVQHELPTDEPLPLTGAAQLVRRPSWERGAANLLFVLDRLREERPTLDLSRVTVMGHSQGGDISMLFVHLHPDRVERVLSLDNRRMPLPRTRMPQVGSIRSSDRPADEGVLPDEREAKEHHILVVWSSVPHHAMDDAADEAQRSELVDLMLALLHGGTPAR